MGRTRIKICGVGRVEDALAAARAGADAIGLVFHEPASRRVSHARARDIIAALPAFVTPVGLFVDATVQHVRATAAELGLRHVQLHGREDADFVAALNEFRIIKSIRVDADSFAFELNAWRRALGTGAIANLRGLVLETASAAPGGTGIANDWKLVRQCQAEGLFEGLPPIIAAGGLTPETVGAVIHDLHPWAVDVSSGVESSKGVKSAGLIEAFTRAVQLSDADS